MELKDIMNSPMLWVMSSFMIINLFLMALMFLRLCFKNAEKLGIPKEECITGLRSAVFTAIGPAFAPVIVLIALMAVLGGPTAWMRMNDIGAARTELAMSAIATGMAGSSLEAGKLTMLGFIFALWGMALNNSGWIIIGGYGAPSLNKAVDYLKNNFNDAWVKLFMAAAALGLFSTLLGNAIIKKGVVNQKNLFAAVVSFVAMLVIGRFFKGNKKIQEFSLGLAMLVGMFVTAAVM
jgi:hypothetical protein